MSILSKQFYVVVDNKGNFVRKDGRMIIHSDSLVPAHMFVARHKAVHLAEYMNDSGAANIQHKKPYTVHPVTTTLGGVRND